MKDVSLAGPDLIRQAAGSEIGSVSLVNPGMPSLVDEQLMEKDNVYGGCGMAGYTLKINPQDLAAIIGAQIFDFTEKKKRRFNLFPCWKGLALRQLPVLQSQLCCWGVLICLNHEK